MTALATAFTSQSLLVLQEYCYKRPRLKTAGGKTMAILAHVATLNMKSEKKNVLKSFVPPIQNYLLRFIIRISDIRKSLEYWISIIRILDIHNSNMTLTFFPLSV